MNSPEISVVMPVWNGEKYLGEALGSVLSQSFTDFEVVIIDDGSTDSTPEILSGFRDSRLRIFRIEHAGLVGALNFGVQQAQARWIARHDADDTSHPLRLEKQWEALRGRKGSVLSYTGRWLKNEEQIRRSPEHLPRTRALLALKLCFENPITHSTAVFNKPAFQAAGGYYNERSEDYSLWGRLAEAGDTVAVAEPLLTLRLLPGSDSKVHTHRNRESAEQIGLKHCARFMRLSPAEAALAHRLLSSPSGPRPSRDWMWFLRHCVPRLRWQSLELHAWLASQTLRNLRPGD
jgi:glycosyltransferase involved in cell wall biosynthesis